jgi:hypothetical protein
MNGHSYLKRILIFLELLVILLPGDIKNLYEKLCARIFCYFAAMEKSHRQKKVIASILDRVLAIPRITRDCAARFCPVTESLPCVRRARSRIALAVPPRGMRFLMAVTSQSKAVVSGC